MNVLSLFDGISCGQIALERAGVKVDKYFASEIDEYVKKVAQKNYPSTIQLGDVEEVYTENLPKIDLLIGGSPCQGFSFAGEQLNFNDPRSRLFFEFARLLKSTNPKYFLLENVNMKKPFQDIISRHLGVEPIEINSDLFIQQNRPRLYWTNIPIVPLPTRPDWDFNYYQYRRTYWRENKSGVCPCLTANMGTGGNNVPYILDGEEKRVLTVNELEQLQTLPIDYTAGISNSQRKKAVGNGWTVDVIAHIFKGLTV